jgi:hypothetical protein
MQEEMDLLKEKGTYIKVQKPPNAVPLANKWVFIWKQNKQGEITRYQACLVVKGCAQCFRQDSIEMFSPVIWMDTIHAILALVPTKNLKVHQMDVKGAYLNGILQEETYMKQPEGCGDGTD